MSSAKTSCNISFQDLLMLSSKYFSVPVHPLHHQRDGVGTKMSLCFSSITYTVFQLVSLPFILSSPISFQNTGLMGHFPLKTLQKLPTDLQDKVICSIRAAPPFMLFLFHALSPRNTQLLVGPCECLALPHFHVFAFTFYSALECLSLRSSVTLEHSLFFQILAS